MSFFESIVLGVVQGVSEFLPISSSAHLILTSHLFGWEDQGLLFDMAVNTGSLVAIVVFARRELFEIAAGAVHAASGWKRTTRYRLREGRFALILVVATIPVAVGGWLGRSVIETAARDPLVIATTSIVFAMFLWFADRRPEGTTYLSDIRFPAAFLIGLAQAVALVPGTSRAGITLTAALLLGFKREAAVRFSFLMAVPVGLIVGASQVAELGLGGATAAEIESMAIGFVAAAASAYAAIVWLVGWIRRQSLTVFVLYRLALGSVILATAIW